MLKFLAFTAFTALIATAAAANAQAETQVTVTGHAESFGATRNITASDFFSAADNDAYAKAQAECKGTVAVATPFTYTVMHGCGGYLALQATATFTCNPTAN